MEWFTRRHAVVFARSSPGRLKYLEKTGLVIPYREGQSEKSAALYSWEQILEIRAIAHLRQHLSFQAIRKIIHYFEAHGFDRSLRNKQLIVNNGSVTWISPSPNVSPQVIQLYSKRNCPIGQFVLAPLALKGWPGDDQRQTTRQTKVVDLKDFKYRLRSSRRC